MAKPKSNRNNKGKLKLASNHFREVWSRIKRGMLYLAAYVWRTIMLRTTFIAITGSLGKTTAKELLAGILESRYSVIKTRGTQNGTTSVARQILKVRPWHRFAVLEVATDRPGWMQRHAWLVRPDLVVILSVAPCHFENYRDLNEVATEKAQLLTGLRSKGVAFLNGDDLYVSQMMPPRGSDIVWFGSQPQFDLWATAAFARWPARLSCTIHTAEESKTVQTQLVGDHWVPAVLAAVAVALRCGISFHDSCMLIEELAPFRARLQPVALPSGAMLLRDDYGGDCRKFIAALKVLAEAIADRRILVMCIPTNQEMTEAERLRLILEHPTVKNLDLIVVVGQSCELAKQIVSATEGGFRRLVYFPQLPAAAEFLKVELTTGDLVLLKGGNRDHLSRILFAQFGEIQCWKPHCHKGIMCDDCAELGATIPLGLLTVDFVAGCQE